MIDFDKGVEKLSKYGGSERKGAVEFNGELYMIKFPDRTRDISNVLSYINNQYSEYLGCHIFQSCGFETQETKLGYFTDWRDERKVVVGCKDFTQDGSTLSPLLSDEIMTELLSNPTELKSTEFNIASCYKVDGRKIIYHEMFKNPMPELEFQCESWKKIGLVRVLMMAKIGGMRNAIRHSQTT